MRKQTFSVALDPQDAEALRKLARDGDLTMGATMRRLIRQEVRRLGLLPGNLDAQQVLSVERART